MEPEEKKEEVIKEEEKGVPNEEPSESPKPSNEEGTEEDQYVKIKVDELENLKKQMEKLSKEQKMLLSVADKKNLSLYYQRNKDDLPTEIKLRVIDGKVVIGWRTVENDVWQTSEGKWIEKQSVEVLYEDGSTERMPLIDFNRRYKHVLCHRMGVSEDREKGLSYKLQRVDNGKTYNVPSAFVN